MAPASNRPAPMRAKSRNSNRGSDRPRANQHPSFSMGYRRRLGRISRRTDWKIRRFWPKMPNSSKTCGPRSGPGGSLSAWNSRFARKKRAPFYNDAAVVNLIDADVARPEFILCRRTVRSSARSTIADGKVTFAPSAADAVTDCFAQRPRRHARATTVASLGRLRMIMPSRSRSADWGCGREPNGTRAHCRPRGKPSIPSAATWSGSPSRTWASWHKG